MTDRPGMDGSSVGTGNAIGTLFDLPPHEANLLEAFCKRALAEAGIDGGAFLRRLKDGQGFGSALGLSEDVIELIYARAHRWFAIGRYERAEPLFRALCVADGRVADFWVGLGVCARLRDDLKSAEIAFRTADRLRPDWAVCAFHLCELSLRAQDFTAAAQHLARFTELADDTIPEAMRAEARRLEAALQMRAAPAPASEHTP